MKKSLAILAILANVFGGKTAPAAVTAAVVNPPQPSKKPVIPKGCKEFVFADGFKCIALNERNAMKKWTNHLENKAVSA